MDLNEICTYVLDNTENRHANKIGFTVCSCLVDKFLDIPFNTDESKDGIKVIFGDHETLRLRLFHFSQPDLTDPILNKIEANYLRNDILPQNDYTAEFFQDETNISSSGRILYSWADGALA